MSVSAADPMPNAMEAPEGTSFMKPAPDVSLEEVKEVFGRNVNPQDPRLKNLLLAIAIDHSDSQSSHRNFRIGIPYIVENGPAYWVGLLNAKNYATDVLVNNALLLLLGEGEAIEGDKNHSTVSNAQRLAAAKKLLRVAGNRGYWPADYYVADLDLKERLAKDYLNFSPLQDELKTRELKALAQETMDRLSRCAEKGFAPCQFSIGEWLSVSNVEGSVQVLQAAIETALRDHRYGESLNNSVVNATAYLISLGDESGLSSDAKKRYELLLKGIIDGTQTAQVN